MGLPRLGFSTYIELVARGCEWFGTVFSFSYRRVTRLCTAI